jgi:DNA-binding NarL/FixJ family response regulator
MNYPPKVMIVEDEGIVSLDMQMLLTLSGFSVVDAADNADDALSQIEKARPDIVLMDIHLKGSMDGVDAASIIRSRYDLPVIFVTAHADAEILERAQLTEPSGYLVKPISGETVKATITMALHNHRMNRERSRPPFRDGLNPGVVVTSRQKEAVYA